MHIDPSYDKKKNQQTDVTRFWFHLTQQIYFYVKVVFSSPHGLKSE